ncbi:amidohydrolase [Agromyces subbeticus]|uniref:amidohydrolase n=1 Tax=Agromyces subbeticus TaxID=293890 RepID=UPI0003F6F93B|nr:amidohydrolase [Agromyces subbeticus]
MKTRTLLGVASVALVVVSMAACTPQPAPEGGAADTVLRNGFVWTVDAKDSQQEAVAIRDGELVYVGTDAGVDQWIGSDTDVIDLDGKMVMPGIQDGHTHTLSGGSALAGCTLNYDPLTVEEFQDRIQGCLGDMADEDPSVPLTVRGWYRQAMQPAGTDADRTMLDALDTDRAIIVNSTDGHSTVVNSAALEAAGVTAQTPDPDGGRIGRDESGTPTGILEDGAGALADALVPEATPDKAFEDDLAAGRAALEALAAQGVVSFMDQFSTDDTAKVFDTLRSDGDLTARVHLAPNVTSDAAANDPRAAADEVIAFRDNWETGEVVVEPGINVTNVGELSIDGVLQAPALTASMLEPYFINTGTEEEPNWVPGTERGPDPSYYTTESLADVTAFLLEAGISPSVHAIGDRGVREVLDAYEIARERTGSELPLSISHAESIAPADLSRFGELDVIPLMGLQWAKPSFDSIEAAQDTLGPERFARTEPAGALAAAGAQVGLGSDWPVDKLNEWLSLEVAVTRANPDGGDHYTGKLGEDPGLTIEEAIRTVTYTTARSMLQSEQTGSLEKGKLADLIVLDQNIMEVPADQIHKTNVLMTMVGGAVVHDELKK